MIRTLLRIWWDLFRAAPLTTIELTLIGLPWLALFVVSDMLEGGRGKDR